MSKHGGIQNELKGWKELSDEERDFKGKNKPNLLRALVHAADISNPTRPYDIAKLWSQRIVSEFFHQGDKERALGVEITMLCDRNKVNFASSQEGFINFVIFPYFNTIAGLIPALQF